MTSFATAEQLRIFLGNATLDTARADLILEGVSDAIRDALGWNVTAETDVVKTFDGDSDQHLFLPTLRLTSVDSVVENGTTLTEGSDFTWRANGVLTRIAGDECDPIRWTCKPRGVVVTFDHGYADTELPGVFRTVALDHAAFFVSNPGGGIKSKSIGAVSFTYADVRTQTEAGEDGRLDRYRIL